MEALLVPLAMVMWIAVIMLVGAMIRGAIRRYLPDSWVTRALTRPLWRQQSTH